MISRPDLLDERSPAGVEVFQLTDEPLPSCHIYMEAQVVTPDSRRLVLHRSAHPHGSDAKDPEHHYLLCDLDDGGALTPMTDELGPTSPALSPDGKWLYYLVNQTEVGGGRLTLKRVTLDRAQRETICVLEGPPRGAKHPISRMYPLSTISSDGRRFATSGFFGDGRDPRPRWGMLVFDLEAGTVECPVSGPEIFNLHPQYCRSTDPAHARMVLIQENHDGQYTLDGKETRTCSGFGDGTGGKGADIHVVRDDGGEVLDLPWGRDGQEWCQGHQAWRGREFLCIGAVGVPEFREERLMESPPMPAVGHVGLDRPGARRNHLSRNFDNPVFFHFASDIAGKRFITDAHPNRDPEGRGCDLWLAGLGQPMVDPLKNWTFLLDTQTTWASPNQVKGHPHPFLSPDGNTAFFNSTESGQLQAYMIRGLENVEV